MPEHFRKMPTVVLRTDAVQFRPFWRVIETTSLAPRFPSVPAGPASPIETACHRGTAIWTLTIRSRPNLCGPAPEPPKYVPCSIGEWLGGQTQMAAPSCPQPGTSAGSVFADSTRLSGGPPGRSGRAGASRLLGHIVVPRSSSYFHEGRVSHSNGGEAAIYHP